jgi:hypothetical protein
MGTVSVLNGLYLLLALYAVTIGLFSLTNPISYVILLLLYVMAHH